MNSPLTAAEETISRYLDGALTPEEAAEFSATLAADPETALTFARMARTELLLAAAFPLRPRRRLFKPLAFAAAAAAVIAAGFFALPHLLTGKPPALPQTARFSDSSGDHPLPAGGKRRTVRPVPVGSDAAWTREELAAAFFTFAVTADPQGLTVPQALTALEGNIRELNFMGRRELNELRFSAGKSLIQHNGNPLIASPLLPPMSLNSFLTICGHYREVIEPENQRFCVSQKALSGNAGKFTDEVHLAPPDLKTTLVARLNRSPSTRLPPSAPLETYLILRDFFGVDIIPGYDRSLVNPAIPSVWDSGAATLTIYGAPAQSHHRVRTFLGLMSASEARRQYFLSTKLARFTAGTQPPGLTDERGILLTDEKFQTICREVADTKGMLLSLPGVVQRQAQRSKVEQTHEVLLSTPGSDTFNYDWVGYQVDLEARAAGEFIYIRGSIDVGIPTGQDASRLEKWGADLAPVAKEAAAAGVAHHVTGFDLWLPNNGTGAFTLDFPGAYVAAFVTVQEVDPSGQPVPPR